MIPVLASFSQVFSARSAVAKRNLTVRPPPERSRDAARLNARGSPSPPARDRGAGCFLSALRRQLSLGDFFFAYFLSLPSLRPPADVDPLTFSPPRSDLQRRDRPPGPRDLRRNVRGGHDLGGPGRAASTPTSTPRFAASCPDAKGRVVVKVVYVVLESQYQSALSAAVHSLNATNDKVCFEVSGYLLEELRDAKNLAHDEGGCREREHLHRLAHLHRGARREDRRRRDAPARRSSTRASSSPPCPR